ncbi:MAG: arginine--tRNA ligase [Desulfobulbaceae bacterium]|uniref:Arginine--tRNA ligase n=1 Tax=Candidatus Desulfobia pelagia TaxID=2841692 RepID=A0A8J6NBR7_9BACT|nr:arginine--tRNA ligase [Candidatus Desulfobia pelagia]
MIKLRLKKYLDQCFEEGVEKGIWSDSAANSYAVEEPKFEGQGDFSTNAAMVIAGKEKDLTGQKVNPRQIAEKIVAMLERETSLLEKVEIAGPGFINFFLKESVWPTVIPHVCSQQEDFGRITEKNGKRVLVEFVSANPTGPLSVGHGRQAVLGDAIARLLDNAGYDVEREYYYNDAGRQMRVLGESTRARYLEELGLPFSFPEDGYQGEYIRDIARALVQAKGDSLKEHEDVTPFKESAEKAIFEDIDQTLKRLDIGFDTYYNEHTLYDNGLIDDVVTSLREKDLVYEKDDAVWFRTTEFGQEKDRVIIKSSGEPTYRLPDIAYHREKFKRGYDWMVNVFGSDHIATVPDVLAGVKALGYDETKITVVLHQFVTLMREGKQVKMSTRKANFVTVDELLDEVGADVARFFFLMRKADSQLEFDLDLATKQSQENPVYYVQYGHARLAGIGNKAGEEKMDKGDVDSAPLHLLNLPEEQKLLKTVAAYPAMVKDAAEDLAPHRIVFYLQDLAGQFHSYYNKHRVISEDKELTRARLWLGEALRIVFHNGLTLLGMSAPDSM